MSGVYVYACLDFQCAGQLVMNGYADTQHGSQHVRIGGMDMIRICSIVARRILAYRPTCVPDSYMVCVSARDPVLGVLERYRLFGQLQLLHARHRKKHKPEITKTI